MKNGSTERSITWKSIFGLTLVALLIAVIPLVAVKIEHSRVEYSITTALKNAGAEPHGKIELRYLKDGKIVAVWVDTKMPGLMYTGKAVFDKNLNLIEKPVYVGDR